VHHRRGGGRGPRPAPQPEHGRDRPPAPRHRGRSPVMTTRTPILFVSHEGTRTGAPMMLLHFLRWLREHGKVDPQIALLRGGPLTEQFAELGPTTVLGDVVDWPTPSNNEVRLELRGLYGPSLQLQRLRMRSTVAPLREARHVYLN